MESSVNEIKEQTHVTLSENNANPESNGTPSELNEENAPPDGWKDEDKVQLECRAKKCSSTLRPDWTSKLDPRYCLDCMPW